MEKVRILLLAVIFVSVYLVLGRTILLAPTAGNSTVTPFVFPTAVPLPEWQPVSSRPLVAPKASSPEFLSGRHYRYIQNDLTLDIEMWYVVDTNGNVKSFIQNYSSVPLSPSQLKLVLHQQSGIGFVAVFAYQQRTYLSTCINSHGSSTVTESQFRRNQYIKDIRLERLIPWLLGRAGVRDQRCLWAHLSIPLRNSPQTDAYQTLEKAWESWYQWWHPRFPKP